MTDSTGWVGGYVCGWQSLSTDHKSSNGPELTQLGQDLFHFSDLTSK